MYRYTRRDFDSVLGFLRGAWKPRNEEQFADYLLSAVPLSASYVVYGQVSIAPFKVFLRTNHHRETSHLNAICIGHLAANPTGKSPNVERLRTGFRWSDHQPFSEFRRSTLYNERYRPCGMRDSLAQILIPNEGADLLQQQEPIRVFGLYHERLISDRATNILASLSPHLQNCFRNVKAFEEMDALHYRFDKLHEGVMEVDLCGKIRFESPRARRFLGEYFESTARYLPEAVSKWMSRSLAALRDATDLPELRLPLIVERGGRRLIVRMFSDQERNLLTFEEQRTSIEPDTLAALGLTRRQAEILAYVAIGKTNPEISVILQTSTRTVSKHLEHIFVRLGVETRTAAAVMAFESARLHS